MIRIFSGLILYVVLTSGPASAQFLGIVESRNITTDETGRSQEFLMTMWIREGMVKIKTVPVPGVSPVDDAMPTTTMIYRRDKRTIWMVNDEEKSYFEVGMEKPGRLDTPPPDPANEYVVTRTGRKKKIAGYMCEQVTFTRGHEVTEVWGTKELAGLAKTIEHALGEEHEKINDSPADRMTSMGLFPLKSVTTLEGNMVVESQEVTKVIKKDVGLQEFAIPDQYTKRDVRMMIEGNFDR